MAMTMGPRYRVFATIGVVTVLGILAYCSQWSNLHCYLKSPWQYSGDAGEGDGKVQVVFAASAENPLSVAFDSVNYTLKRTPLEMQVGLLEVYTPPSVPCSGTKHPEVESKMKADILVPSHFIPESKNPCWWNGTSGSTQSQIHCLPYFFLAGVSKCGSTDIFSRLSGHPQVIPPAQKEARWFDKRRFFSEEYSFGWYLSNFMQAAWQISRDIGSFGMSDKVVGDGSPTYFWRNFNWPLYPGNEGCSEPRVLISDIIHQILPQAKILISFRNPINSIYSKYLSLGDKGIQRSPQHFHSSVQQEILRYQHCFIHSSVRSCAYNISLSEEAEVRLEKGMYAVFLSDWLRVFPRKQLYIIKFEDYVANIAGHLQDIFQFLELDAMPDNALSKLASLPPSNKGSHYNVGPMLPATRQLLQQFYSPFNAQLADMVKDKKFLWLSE